MQTSEGLAIQTVDCKDSETKLSDNKIREKYGIVALKRQIYDELSSIYTEAIVDNFDEEETECHRIYTRLARPSLDIDEFCVSHGDSSSESFTVENGNILWVDESDEWHSMNEILGFTPEDIAEDAYCEVIDWCNENDSH